jgi:DNA-directed RNA polymerase specialized sigma24 family protein
VEVEERLRQVVEGEREAAAWLYDTFAPRLYRRLRLRYGQSGGGEPEDLLQDSFVFYFQNGCKVLRDFLVRPQEEARTAAALERHLWDLACGVAANRRRSAWGRKVVLLDDFRGASPEAGAERGLLARDSLGRLDDCLKGANRRVYLYYKLRYFDGLSPEEISQAAGWSRKASYKLKESLNEAVRRCSELLGLAG